MSKSEEFMEALKPWLDKIPKRQLREVSEDEIQKLEVSFKRTTRHTYGDFATFLERVLVNEHVMAARLLRALETSWAPYDNHTTIKDIMNVGIRADGEIANSDFVKLRVASRKLEELGFIEVQGDRMRIKKS